MLLEENVSLAPLTTLRIGGPARYFVRAESETVIPEAVDFASERDLSLFILGAGSNLLVSDGGFDGLVLNVAILGISGLDLPARIGSGQRAISVTAGAGEDWDGFVKRCVEANLAGVECLSGIPGLVGGVPVQNVGAYGQEVSETITSVRCFDRKTGAFVTLSNSDCGFSYRSSIFNTTERDRYVVAAATFTLLEGGDPRIAYPELERTFQETSQPTLAHVREQISRIRRAKSMIIDPSDPNSRSAGSFFKNPIVEQTRYEELKAAHADMPSFPSGSKVKIPAAWLIEHSGFQKGFEMGQAGISTNHTLALINRGRATAREIVLLKNKIQTAVQEVFGIEMVPEPVLIGF